MSPQTPRYRCEDCSALFVEQSDAIDHERRTDGHTTRPLPSTDDPRRTPEHERRAVERQTPRGRRERHLDGQGQPRPDY